MSVASTDMKPPVYAGRVLSSELHGLGFTGEPITGEHGSGMIFFTGCPLHCQYCQNRQISGSDGLNYGIDFTVEEMAELMLSLQKMGAATLNLVTGTHFIPSIISSLEIAKGRGFSLPVVWNSSGYENEHALSLIV